MYIKGSDLSPAQRRQVLATFVYRDTLECPHPSESMRREHPPTDDEWLASLAFPFVPDGSRLKTGRRNSAVPHDLVDK
jgi:hypothetical protein